MEQSSEGLEDIFDKNLKAFAASDYKDLKNPVEYHQNSIFVKQLEQRTLCSRARFSPTPFPPPRGRSASPTVLCNLNLNSPNWSSPSNRRIKPDPLVANLNPACKCNNEDLGVSTLSNHVKSPCNVVASGLQTVAGYARPTTPCDSSISPKRIGSPSLQSKVLASRDKESLMDEIIDLKKALLDQSAALQRQKVLSMNLELENRKLEKELEELAYQGNGTKGVSMSRTSSMFDENRLRSKVHGLKSRVAQLEATCEVQQDELAVLRRDIRVTRTRALQKSLEKANKGMHESSRRGNESLIRAKRAERQCQDLQEQSTVLSKMVEKEKSEKLKLQQMIHVLQDELQNLEASVSSKAKLQSSSNSENQHEVHQPGIFAKTWGFLHDGPFHASKSRELDTAECEKLILGERPKTRGEQRTKLTVGDSSAVKKSRCRSPARPTNKKAIELPKSMQGLIRNHAQREPHPCPASEAHVQGEICLVRKPTVADEPAQSLIDRPQMLPISRPYSEDLAQKANPFDPDRSQNSIQQQPGKAAPDVDEHCENRDTVARLVEGIINTQESLYNREKQNNSNDLQEPKESDKDIQDGSAQASLGPKSASSVLVPRLNLHQVGGHPHHGEDHNSKESSNAHQTSTTNSNLLSSSTLTALEQSHQKVIAWDDNIHHKQDQYEGLAPNDPKLAIIPERIIVNEA